MSEKRAKHILHTRHIIEKSLQHHVIEWLATILSLTGVAMVASKHRTGFAIWLVANVLWMSFSLKHKHWGLFILSVCYLVINTYGFFTW